MSKKTPLAAVFIMGSMFAAEALAAAQGRSGAPVFNRRFVERLKPMMPYSQLLAAAGGAGTKVGEDKTGARYHWNGARKTALDAKVAAGKVVEATVTTPKGKKIPLGSKRGFFD